MQTEMNFSGTSPKKNLTKPWSVSELTERVKGHIEPEFNSVWVQGELSNARPPGPSGHFYFSLKDQNSMIACASFGYGARQKSNPTARFNLTDGLEVLCFGKVTIYGPRGTYQLVVERIEPVGAGALQLAFEQLKAKLQAEGLFDSKRKRKLPAFPKRIAVVTSPTTAALKDILNVLARRAPQIQITVVPALVQGEEAANQLIRAIEQANQYHLGDVILLARGGGSAEDLWCFNDERLARAIAASALPVVSAVGHEIDFTIADFVADLRAPTPSAGAELLSTRWVEVTRVLIEIRERLFLAWQRSLLDRKKTLENLSLKLKNPKDKLGEQAQRLDEYSTRLERAVRAQIERSRYQIQSLTFKVDALSPLKVLERGYALVEDLGAHEIIGRAAQLHQGQNLEIRFHDGKVQVQVL